MATQTAAVTQLTLRTTATVLPGNKIEIQLPPDAVVGEEVEVFVVLPEPPKVETQVEDQPKYLNVLEIIEEGRRHRIGMSADQIDEYLRTERESWER